jgi:hypothetical protein
MSEAPYESFGSDAGVGDVTSRFYRKELSESGVNARLGRFRGALDLICLVNRRYREDRGLGLLWGRVSTRGCPVR